MEWEGQSIYGNRLHVQNFGAEEILLDVGKSDAVLSVQTAKDLRKALKKAIKKIEG